jgi:hypothetical protein
VYACSIASTKICIVTLGLKAPWATSAPSSEMSFSASRAVPGLTSISSSRRAALTASVHYQTSRNSIVTGCGADGKEFGGCLRQICGR